MSIFMPEKIIIGALTAGLTTIKANPDIIDDVFNADVLGAGYVANVKAYLAAHKVHITQGYGVDENRLPGWYVVPASISPDEALIGDFVEGEETDEDAIDGDDIEGRIHRYNLRVISASMNGDVTLFLEAIARYILQSGNDWGEGYGLHELDVTATDFDPIYQYLPQHLFYRSTVAAFRGLSTWSRNYIIIKDAQLFIKFDPNEAFIQV